MRVNRTKSVIIVGCGIGGVALAARLGRDGFDVKVYEKNGHSGGRLSSIQHNGFRFDQGPSLYLMPTLFEETFTDLGEKIGDHLDLIQCETNYSIYFGDGDRFKLSCNLANLYEQIKKYEGNSEKTMLRFMDFIKETHVHYERSIAIALKQNYEHWYNQFQLKHVPNVFRLHLWSTVYGRVKKFFRTDKMRQAFSFQTMYIGMSPYDTPALFNLLQYTELAEGIWYPRGGFYKVVKALENIATKKFGVEFKYNMNVEKIVVDEQMVAKGVRLDDGSIDYADIIVCNADLIYAYNHLLPETPYAKKLSEKAVLTSSSISFYWGMKCQVPELDVHNVFLANDYKASYDNVFKRHILSEDPFFYVNVPSRIDSSAAPDGKDSVVVLLPVSHLTSNNENCMDEWIKIARDRLIRIIEHRLKIKNLESLIEHETINDPRTWQMKFNLWKGSILGMSHNISQVLHYRPSIRCNEFKNLYFVGANAHPGTGVPVVLCGAQLVEKQILKDYGFIERGPEDLIIILQFILFGLLLMIIFGLIGFYFLW